MVLWRQRWMTCCVCVCSDAWEVTWHESLASNSVAARSIHSFIHSSVPSPILSLLPRLLPPSLSPSLTFPLSFPRFLPSFFHSFFHSFLHSFLSSFLASSLAPSLFLSLPVSLRSFVCLFVYHIHSFTPWFIHSVVDPPIHPSGNRSLQTAFKSRTATNKLLAFVIILFRLYDLRLLPIMVNKVL